MKIESLHDAVVSLQEIFTQTSRSETPSPQVIRTTAQKAGFDPDLAEQVARRLSKDETTQILGRQFSRSDISDALVSLLLDESAPTRQEALSATVRAALKDAGKLLGVALADIYEQVSQFGMGLYPTLPELANEIHQYLVMLEQKGDGQRSLLAALQTLANSENLDPWKASLLRVWLRSTRYRAGGLVTESDMIDFFGDDQSLGALKREDADGPWDVYAAQAKSVRSHRNVGDALADLVG